jgi:hypothetical protein
MRCNLTERINRTATAVFIVTAMSFDLSAATAIGTASALGTFAIDHARVEQATVFDGSTIATGKASAQVDLQSGTRMLLGASSEGTIYRDRLVLGQGQTQLDTSSAYGLETAGLRVEAGAQPSSLRLTCRGQSVEFSSLRGAFTIRDLQGRVLASAKTGDNLQLTPVTSNTSTVNLTGKIRSVAGKYLLTDETTRITVELQGESVAGSVGKRVRLTGSAASSSAAPGAPRVVTVSSLHVAGSGLSTKAIIGGLVIASGTGVALGVGLTQDDPKAPASR